MNHLCPSLLVMTCLVLHAGAYDPMYSDEEVKEIIAAYKDARPSVAATRRSADALPLALRLTTVRLPAFKLAGSSLDEALDQLRDLARKANERDGRFHFVPHPDAVPSKASLSLDLSDVTVGEALKYVMELGGCGFEVTQEQIVYGEAPAKPHWRRLMPACFDISEALASKWFPGTGIAKSGTAVPVSPAEAMLGKLGILLPAEASADFVSGINVLAVNLPPVASDCLQTLIEESESELLVLRTGAGELKPPQGMKLMSLPLHGKEPDVFKTVLVRKNGVIQPFCISTSVALRFIGVSFPKGSAAWLDRKARTLHVINTEVNMKTIRSLMASE
jgi:hypothetical protein